MDTRFVGVMVLPVVVDVVDVAVEVVVPVVPVVLPMLDEPVAGIWTCLMIMVAMPAPWITRS